MSSFHRLFSILVVAGLLATQAGSALANGGAVKIPLKYLAAVSNWGPTGATGLGSVDVSDGEVIITVAGLPQLGADRYEGWLVSGTEMVSVGKFNTDANATAYYKIIMERLPARKYDLFVISVEPEPDVSATADRRFSIGGYFSDMLPTPTHGTGGTAQPAVTPQPGTVGTPRATLTAPATPGATTLPRALPATGEFVSDSVTPELLLLALGASIAAALLTTCLRDDRKQGGSR